MFGVFCGLPLLQFDDNMKRSKLQLYNQTDEVNERTQYQNQSCVPHLEWLVMAMFARLTAVEQTLN